MTSAEPSKTRGNKIAFISGPLFPPENYFETHYLPHLHAAISQEHNFVVGPAPGIDTVSLHYLLTLIPASRITVYLARFEAVARRSSYAPFEATGGKIVVEGATTGERDAAMTRDSDHDILRYMPEDEARAFYGPAYLPRVTNTEKNERRRKREPLHYNPALEKAEKEKERDGKWWRELRW